MSSLESFPPDLVGHAFARYALWLLMAIHAKETVELLFQVAMILFGYGRDLGIFNQRDQTGKRMRAICGCIDKDRGNKERDGLFTFPPANPTPSLETLADLLFLTVGYLAIAPGCYSLFCLPGLFKELQCNGWQQFKPKRAASQTEPSFRLQRTLQELRSKLGTCDEKSL